MLMALPEHIKLFSDAFLRDDDLSMSRNLARSGLPGAGSGVYTFLGRGSGVKEKPFYIQGFMGMDR
jgi:hypothetical protein